MKFTPNKYSQDLKRYYRLPSVQISLTVVLSVFVTALFIFVALRPTLVSIGSLKTVIAESNKTSKILKNKVSNLQTAFTQFESLKSALPTINANIPNNNVKYGSFIATIEALANQSGVSLDTENLGASLLFSKLITPYNPDKDQSVLSLQFSISATGSFPQLDTFLRSLLSMERVVAIDSVTISPQSAKKGGAALGTSNLKIDIAGKTFYLADEAEITKILDEKKGKK